MKLRGAELVIRNLLRQGARGRKAVGSALRSLGEDVSADAVRRAPVDTGALRGSHYTEGPVERGQGLIVETGFGGPAKDYAVVQHEDTSLNHPEGGEAKFLENAINDARPTALAELAARAKREWGA